MTIDAGPLHKFIPNPPEDRADARAWYRSKTSGRISEAVADRLLLRYANIQLELVYGNNLEPHYR